MKRNENQNFYLKAYELAKKAKYICKPNPAVGALIVKNNVVIGVGHTQSFGENHAEIEAIKSIKEKSLLTNSHLYVTLMPCDYHKKTPPCSKAIIEAKISAVHIANYDPLMPTKKLEKKFKEHGIKIFYDFPQELSEKIFFLNIDFYQHSLYHTPFFTVKYAMTMDGKIATRNFSSKWISNSSSRENVHRERSKHDAICVGQNTLVQDNPRLNIRLKDLKNTQQPLVLLPLSRDTLIPNLKIFKQKKVLFLVKKEFKKSIALIEKNKKEFIFYKKDFFTKSILEKLTNIYHVNSVFVEGGGHLQSHLLQHGLIDKVSIYIASKILGDGEKALSPFSFNDNFEKKGSFDSIKQATQIHFQKTQLFENDIHVEGYLDIKKINRLRKKIIPKVN